MGQIAAWQMNGLQPYTTVPEAREMEVQFAASQTLAKGTVVGQVTATKKFKPYVDGNSDGTQVAKGILKYDIVVDANGKIAFGANITIGPDAQLYETAPVYRQGVFKTTDLTGLDAAGVTDLGRLESGSVADGILTLI